MVKMRAKMRVSNIHYGENYELLTFNAVSKSDRYPPDGTDENNTFAKWTPNAELKMMINNPNLHNQFEINQEFYVDFTLVNKN